MAVAQEAERVLPEALHEYHIRKKNCAVRQEKIRSVHGFRVVHSDACAHKYSSQERKLGTK
jgi:hypothetical protein